MFDNKLFPIVEGILFTMGEPCELEKIAYALDMDIITTREFMDRFLQDYNKKNTGMQIIEVEDSYQMVSNPEIFEYLIKVAKQPKKYKLSQGTLETLAIIACKQPVTKLDIEKIRGVKSDYMVSRLLEFELIEEIGRAQTVGHPLIFGTTKKFLRIFGLKSTEELKDRCDINIDMETEDLGILKIDE